MHRFEQLFSRPIPLEKAAAYFLRLKGGDCMTPAQDREFANFIKKAEEQELTPEQESAVRAQLEQLTPLQRAQLGAAYGVQQVREPGTPSVPLHAAGGAASGAALGAGAGAGLSALTGLLTRGRKVLPLRAASALGGGLGLLAGGGGGAVFGEERKEDYTQGTGALARQLASQVPTIAQASAQHGGAPIAVSHEGMGYGSVRGVPTPFGIYPTFNLPEKPKEAAAVLRERLQKFANEAAVAAGSGSMAPPGGTPLPGLDEYMARESEGMAAETQNAINYFRQKAEEAQAEAAMARDEAAQATMGMDELSMAQGNHETQLSAYQQEGQIAQQAALQQVQQATEQATQALQSAIDAEQRVLEARAQETSTKMLMQQFRQLLMDMALNGPPGTEPQVPQAPDAGMNQAGQPLSAEGMPGQEASGELGAALPPGATPPSAGASGGSNTGQPPQEKAQDDGKTEEQRDTNQPRSQVTVKTSALNPRTIGTAVGGLFGAGLAGAQAAGVSPGHLESLRGKVERGAEEAKQPGLKGFSAALELAKDRAMLTLGEATEDHPVAATITGGLMGAGIGYNAGPEIAKSVREAMELRKNKPLGPSRQLTP